MRDGLTVLLLYIYIILLLQAILYSFYIHMRSRFGLGEV